MRFFWSLSRILAKPTTIWGLFSIVLVLAAGGLALLSRHALQLSERQAAGQAREELLQNLRVSLWRLDSRLGPYIATLHDPDWGGNFHELGGSLDGTPDGNFVIQRFNIEHVGKGQDYVFVPTIGSRHGTKMMPSGKDGLPDSSWASLLQSIPVKEVVDAVQDLLPPQVPPPMSLSNGQRIVQSYNIAPQQQAANPRGNRELQSRDAVVQNQFVYNTLNGALSFQGKQPSPAMDRTVDEPLLETKLLPVWIDEHLIVVRASRTHAGELEGVWVDWPALSESLAGRIADLVPGASLQPIRQNDTVDPERTLAAIPAMVVAPMPIREVQQWSPTHTALCLAWCALLGSALLAAFALNRLIALSERRASFVSAVTHELRTPLTTFRLYSDLLVRDMIQDPQDRQEYLQTLRREADRLTHLVDNVLRYSKLQGTSKRAVLERVVLSEWIDRITPRLAARLAAAKMTLVVDQEEDGHWDTDPPAMEQVLFNLIDNAAKYAGNATDRRVHLQSRIEGNMVSLVVSDHGPGVPLSLRGTIFHPFAKSAERAAETAAGVGLGLALARQTVLALGGKLNYQTPLTGGASFCIEIPATGVPPRFRGFPRYHFGR